MLVDAHCHLDWFDDKKQVVEDAKSHGVTTMVSCATNLKSVKEHLLLPEMFPEVKICLGLHPSNILRMSNSDLMHWFTNSVEEVKDAIDLGYFISVGPAVIQSIAVQKIVKEIPLSNLMLETDAPVSFQGKKSTSRWIEWVAEKIAEIQDESFKNVAETTTENAKNFFNF